MKRNRRNTGYSALELLLVVAILGIFAAASLPHLMDAMQRARANGAAEVLAVAIRDARMRAINNAYQYRVSAYDGTGAVPNAFRIEGSADGGVTWPATGTVTTPAGPLNDVYTDLAKEFKTAQTQVAGGTFRVTFDSRGQRVGACVPATCVVQVTTAARTATVTVTTAGGVRVQ
jgi:prepilin-type N-terminal cleavage/methylation domain-containing protein